MLIKKSLFIIALATMFVTGLFAAKILKIMGSTDSPSAPGATNSFNLEDVYQRLDTGAAGAQSTFTEPTDPPGTGTMHTLNEIMIQAPTADNTNGATKADVANTKKYWSLRTDGSESSSWGLETGELYGGFTLKAGGTLVSTRWYDNGDGTVTDLLGHNGAGKGLVWLQKADWGGFKPWQYKTTFYDDVHSRSGHVREADPTTGLSDHSVIGYWRLPTKSELLALSYGIEYVRSNFPRAFTGVQSSYYWSSTTYTWGSYNAWIVTLDDGTASKGAKVDSFYVWPVRAGQ